MGRGSKERGRGRSSRKGRERKISLRVGDTDLSGTANTRMTSNTRFHMTLLLILILILIHLL